MSTLKTKKVQLGDNADPSKNFLIEVPAVADGTLSIKRANGTSVLSVGSDGSIDLNAAWKSYTPVLSGGTSAGVGTYSSQVGDYLDLGSLVFLRIRLDWSAHTGTGVMQISLPTDAGIDPITVLSTYADGVNVGTNNTPIGVIINSGGTRVIQIYGINNVSGGTVALPNMDSQGSLVISGCYRKI